MSIVPYAYVVKSCILLVPYLIIVFQFRSLHRLPYSVFFLLFYSLVSKLQLFYLQVYYIISFGTDQQSKFTFCYYRRYSVIRKA